jgi:predicted nucleic acid-binding Zn ribbon protein
MSARDRDPASIGDALEAVLRGLGTPGVQASLTVFGAWDDLVGDEVAAHARPVSLDAGCLLVAVDAPVWATKVRYSQSSLLRRCAESLGEGVVTRLEVTVKRS